VRKKSPAAQAAEANAEYNRNVVFGGDTEARFERLEQALLAFKEAAVTAILTAANDTNIDHDFAIGLAIGHLQEEEAKVQRCDICDYKRTHCGGCERKVACKCSDTPKLCFECEWILKNAAKRGVEVQS
jgi:hypothetical protein